MSEDGRLGPDALQVGEREFRVGDQIVCGHNARARLGVVNGTRGEVTALDASQRALTITTDDGKVVTLPGWYVAGRGHDDQPWVDHGYAITGHKTQGLTGDDFGVRPSTRADAHWSYVAASRHRIDLRLYLVEELDRPAEDTRHTLDPLDDRVAATVRAMGRPGEQSFAIDQELLAEVRQLTVPQLRQERDRLRELLGGAPESVAHRITLAEERQRQAEAHLAGGETASPAAGGWAGRAWRRRSPDPGRAGGQLAMARAAAVRVADHAAAELVDLRRQQQQHTGFLERHQPAAARYGAVVAELGWRTRATSRALEVDPPAWLSGLLGEVPEAGRGRRAWRQTAARLQSYRDSYQLRDPQRALGQEPTGDLTQRRAWRAAQQAIDRYQRHHRTREQRHQRPHERDRASTRTRTQARDREREAG
jgi:hypothetical protein